MTKAQYNMFLRYLGAKDTSLYDCYKKPSMAKQAAYADCMRRYRAMRYQLNSFKIVSHNAQTFTVAWLYKDNDGDYCLHYETAYHTYEFCIG